MTANRFVLSKSLSLVILLVVLLCFSCSMVSTTTSLDVETPTEKPSFSLSNFLLAPFTIFNKRSGKSNGGTWQDNLGQPCALNNTIRYCGEELICSRVTLTCSFCSNNTQCEHEIHDSFRCKPVQQPTPPKNKTVAVDMDDADLLLSSYSSGHSSSINYYINNLDDGGSSSRLSGVEVEPRICQHKNLFKDGFSVWDILATSTNFVGGVLSGAGGIGGGGLFVPLLQLLGQFPPTVAIPLSKAMIFGGALLNVIVMTFQTHPEDPSKPLINYDAALVFEPFTLIGTTVGVICNITFPEWLTVSLLFLILGFTTVRTFQKGFSTMRKELKQKSQKAASSSVNSTASSITQVAQKTPRWKSWLSLSSKIGILIFCWCIIITMSLLRGGHGADSVAGVKPCSPVYWTLFGLQFPIFITICTIIGSFLVYRDRNKIRKKSDDAVNVVAQDTTDVSQNDDVQYPEESVVHLSSEKTQLLSSQKQESTDDIIWTLKTVTLYPMFCFVAGIMAALLGIGGGMIKGPLLLEMGMDGSVASATSSIMVFFTSSITTAQYIILKRLPWDYGLWFMIIGFLSSLLGQIVIGYPARRFRITFLIVFSVAIVIGLATALMGGLGVYSTVMDIKDKLYLGFKPVC